MRPGTLDLGAGVIPVVFLDAEGSGVEGQGPIEVGDREADMREAMRTYQDR